MITLKEEEIAKMSEEEMKAIGKKNSEELFSRLKISWWKRIALVCEEMNQWDFSSIGMLKEFIRMHEQKTEDEGTQTRH